MGQTSDIPANDIWSLKGMSKCYSSGVHNKPHLFPVCNFSTPIVERYNQNPLNQESLNSLLSRPDVFLSAPELWAVMDATANESLTDMQIRQVGISEGNERDGNISSITDALEPAKLTLLPEMMPLSKNDFLMKVHEFCPDTETLRYTRDLLFHITRRRKGKKSIRLVERKASEHVRSKLMADLHDIYLVGEGTKCNFPSHLVRGSEGYKEHVELDSESEALNEIKQKISKEFETKFDELQGEIKDMQRNMRDVIKRMNDSAATPSHGNSINTFGASPGNVVGLNESVGNVINDDMAKESNVEFTEGMKTISVRRDL